MGAAHVREAGGSSGSVRTAPGRAGMGMLRCRVEQGRGDAEALGRRRR
jgi:hypothetical protein